MPHPLLLILGGLLVGWSFLSVLGNERQRLVRKREAEPRRPKTPDESETAVGQ